MPITTNYFAHRQFINYHRGVRPLHLFECRSPLQQTIQIMEKFDRKDQIGPRYLSGAAVIK